MARKSKSVFKMKGHTLPGINQKSETANLKDGKIKYKGQWRDEGWEQFPWEKLAYKVGGKAKKEAEKKNT